MQKLALVGTKLLRTSIYLVACEGDLHIRIDEILGFTGKSFLHIGHDARVHLG